MSGGHPQICHEMCPNTCKFPYKFPYSTVNYVPVFRIVKRPVELNTGLKNSLIPGIVGVKCSFGDVIRKKYPGYMSVLMLAMGLCFIFSIMLA